MLQLCRWRFSHKETFSRHYSSKSKFYFKKQKSLFVPPFGWLKTNVYTPAIDRWKKRGDFLSAIIELFRPPDIHVGGLIFYYGFFLLSFFAVWSPSSLNGTQPYPVTWLKVSVIWKRMFVANYKGLQHRLKTTWTLAHKRLQIGSEFSPTLRKFCIHFIVILCRRKSANGTLPNFTKRWTVGPAKNLP